MIPSIIHYCWYGNKKMSLKTRKCIASWEKYCPNYRIQRWDETNTDFQQNALLLQLNEEKRWALLSDIVRLQIVL